MNKVIKATNVSRAQTNEFADEKLGSPLDVAPEKEKWLKEELDSLDSQLLNKRQLVERLRRENDWLKNEIDKSEGETHDYVNYLMKKTTKKKALIVSLADRNKIKMDNVISEKHDIQQKYSEIKKEHRQTILELEGDLARKNNELEKLTGLKQKREEQREEVQALEQSIRDKQRSHAVKVETMKENFLLEKLELQQEADTRVATMENKANLEAKMSLQQQALRIKEDNDSLRTQLLSLIQEAKALQKKVESLEKQNISLNRQQELNDDMQRLKHMRMKKKVRQPASATSSGSTTKRNTPKPPQKQTLSSGKSNNDSEKNGNTMKIDSNDDDYNFGDFYDK